MKKPQRKKKTLRIRGILRETNKTVIFINTRHLLLKMPRVVIILYGTYINHFIKNMRTQTLNNLIFIGLVFAIVLLLAIVPGLSFAQTDSFTDGSGSKDDGSAVTTSATSVSGEAGNTDSNSDGVSDDSNGNLGGDSKDTSTDSDTSGDTGTRVQNLRDSFRENIDAARETGATDALRGDATGEDGQIDRQTDLESRRADQEEKREERREALNERAKERIRAYAERIGKRFNAALDRISKMADRVDSRIDKFEERGLDMSDAQALVDTARAQVSDARSDVSDALAQIETLLNSDNPREIFASVKELLVSAKESAKAAHASLVEAVRSMKAGLAKERDSGSGNENGETDEE